MIRAYLKSAELEVLLAFGEFILIEKYLFWRGEAALLAALNRILFAFLRARVVIIAAILHGHAEIGLLDAPQDSS